MTLLADRTAMRPKHKPYLFFPISCIAEKYSDIGSVSSRPPLLPEILLGVAS